jgi:hypothetical protein
MSNIPEYKVDFGSEAWTLIYEDKLGKFILTFEGDFDEYRLKGSSKKIYLGRHPAQDGKIFECQTLADQERIALILERVQQYLSSLGYQVANI